jgi:hypothetical protein
MGASSPLNLSLDVVAQAHPDKALAQKLHALRPDQYKDDNHKPGANVGGRRSRAGTMRAWTESVGAMYATRMACLDATHFTS